MSDSGSRFEVKPDVSNHFSWIRTQLGLQRTLMAAVRTSVSLVGFGFTVAQFFAKLQANGEHTFRADMPRNLGLVLIAAGVISLASFTWQYHIALKYMHSGDLDRIAMPQNKSMHTSVYLVTWIVMMIGVAAFFSVFAKF